jgi:hypothetical protein
MGWQHFEVRAELATGVVQLHVIGQTPPRPFSSSPAAIPGLKRSGKRLVWRKTNSRLTAKDANETIIAQREF